MIIRSNNTSATAAAEIFARENWSPSRKVGETKTENGQLWFKLVNGVKWYRVMSLGVVGWEVIDAE